MPVVKMRAVPAREAARATAIPALSTAALVLVTAALAGCRERPRAGEGSAATASAVAWTASCGPALQRLDEVPPEKRVAAVLASCPVCAAGPLLRDRRGLRRTATYLADMDAAMQACGGFCSRSGRNEFMRSLQHQLDTGEPSARPWQLLGEACPAEIGARDGSRNFAGATWFLLERIARTAGGELAGPLAAAAPFPLPAVATGGRGLELPAAPPASGERGAQLVVPGRLAVTVLADQALVGRLPWGRLTAAGVMVDGDYPGARADELGAALAAQEQLLGEMAPSTATSGAAHAATSDAMPSAEPVTLLAPSALPARRVVELVGRLGRPARLAVLLPSQLPEYELPMVLPAVLSATPAPGARRLSLEEAARSASQPGPLTLAIGPAATVDELATALARRGAVALVADPSP